MSTIMESARGASAFTYPTYDSFRENRINRSSIVENLSFIAIQWKQIIDELKRIRKLQDDWDSEGAIAPSPEIVDSAIALAVRWSMREKEPPIRVHASVNGTVYFEWDNAERYQELEIFSGNHAERRLLYKNRSHDEKATTHQICW